MRCCLLCMPNSLHYICDLLWLRVCIFYESGGCRRADGDVRLAVCIETHLKLHNEPSAHAHVCVCVCELSRHIQNLLKKHTCLLKNDQSAACTCSHVCSTHGCVSEYNKANAGVEEVSLSLFSFQFCVKRKRLSIITLEWRFHGQKLI